MTKAFLEITLKISPEKRPQPGAYTQNIGNPFSRAFRVPNPRICS